MGIFEHLKRKRKQSKRKSPLVSIEALEPRLLYSADLLGSMIDGDRFDTNQQEELDAQLLLLARASANLTLTAQNQNDLDEAQPFSDLQTLAQSTMRVELVVIDSATEDYQRLVDDIIKQTDDNVRLEFAVIDSQQNGVDQISDLLSQYTNLSALHIVSHGTDGAVDLGNTQLNNHSLLKYSEQLQNWGESLDSEADILFYSCELTASEEGTELINQIANLTGADIAASDDLTGSSQLGGDWVLEYQTGEIEANVAFSFQAQTDWSATLATYTVTNTSDSGAGSLRQAILDANTNTGTDNIIFNIGSGDAGYIDPTTGAPLSGDEYWSIQLSTVLPAITEALVLDASTQNTFAGTPVIELDGSIATGSDENGITIETSGVTIRGFVINRFADDAIEIDIQGGSNTIVGNYLGTDITGQLSGYGNLYGITIKSDTNIIGGTTDADRNIISGNTSGTVSYGIGFWQDADSNLVQGNYIGVGADGTIAIGNEQGIIFNGTNDLNQIGGDSTAGEANIIANSDDLGIAVLSSSANSNPFLENSIYGNMTLGIDLGTSGITANDTGDGDSGANNLQNYPLLSTATATATEVTIAGTLNSLANSYFRIEFYANVNGDSLGNGEGQTYLGSANVTTNGSGNASINEVLTASVTQGTIISATATKSDASFTSFTDTSEFAVNITATSTNNAPTVIDSSVTVNEDATYVFTVSDFNYSDSDGDPISKIQITNLPTVGVFKLNGTNVTLNQEISKAEIDAGLLTFKGQANASGLSYDSFEYRVHDGSLYSEGVSLTTHFDNTFDANEEGFTYADISNAAWASGNYDPAGGLSGGGLHIDLGTGVTGGASSGGWSKTFTLSQATEITISTQYKLIISSEYEATEYGELFLKVDGVAYGNDTNNSLIHQVGDGNGGSNNNSGWLSYETTLTLAAGSHTLELSANNNNSTATDEWVEGYFDNVSVTSATYNSMTIDVDAVNDAPVLSSPSGTYPYTENAGAVLLGASATITDIDSTDFNGGQLVYQITNNGLAEDRLDIRNQGTAAGQIGVSGLNISYGGTLIGTYAGPTNGSSALAVTFNASATVAAVEATLKNITYENISDDPTASTRTLELYATDGNGGTSNTIIGYVGVTPENDAAVIASIEGSNLAYTENDGAVEITSTLSLSDVDDTQIDAAEIKVTGNYVNGEDVLAFVDQNGISGSWNPSTGALSLSGNATVANYEAAITSITYTNDNEDPNTATRTVSFTVNDGDVDSNTQARDITVSAVNNAPVIASPSGTYPYTENAGAVLLGASATITDIDSTDFNGGQLVYQITNNGLAEDRLDIRNQGTAAGQIGVSGLNVSYGGTIIGTYTGAANGSSALVVSFNASATVDAVQATLNNVTYENTSDDPTASTRTLDLYATDGDGGTSNTIIGYVAVTPVNDAPVLDASAANLWFSTAADVSGSSANGLANWTDGEMLQFGASDLSFGENTSDGTFSSTGFNLDTLAGGDADIDAMHYVSQTVTVGSGDFAMDLLAGDLLLSTQSGETLTSTNSLTVTHEDIFIFRPDTPGDYSAGTFIFLLDKPTGGDATGISLVEQNTIVGDVALEAGTFILAKGDKAIYHYTADTIGESTTTGALITLVDASDIGIDKNISGVSLVHNTMTTGGVTLNSGQLLVTLVDEDNNVGGFDTERRDIIALTITQTGSATLGSASGIFFDGDDVGLSSNDEDLDALTLVPHPSLSPIVEDISSAANNGTLVSELIANLIVDLEGDPDGIAITALDETNGSWEFSIDGGSNWQIIDTVTDSSARVLTATASDLIRFVPTADFSGSASITFRAWDGSDSSTSGASGIDASSNGGAEPFSDTAVTANIDIRGINDSPVLNNNGADATLEDTPLVFNTANGNLLSISDDDVGTDELEITLGITNGSISLSGTSGLTFSTGSGVSDTNMVLRGTLVDLNNALDGLSYTPTAYYTGDASLSIQVNELRNSYLDDNLFDQQTLLITVTPDATNDAPVNTVPGPQVVDEDTWLELSVANGNAISIVDDSGNNPIQVTLTAGNGVLTLDNRLGSEFTINSTTAGTQSEVEIITTDAGIGIAVWNSKDQDTDGEGIFAQLYDADGVALGGEFQVNSHTVNHQNSPAVAAAADGSFVVVWQSKNQDGDSAGIYAQRFDAAGNTVGSEFMVNSYTVDDQQLPAVAMNASGDFVVTWQSKGQDTDGEGIYAQRYDNLGNTVGGELLVNANTADNQKNPDVAIDANGNFVVVWDSKGQDASSEAIIGRRFDSVSGLFENTEFQINTHTDGAQKSPVIGMQSTGAFVVAWTSANEDGSRTGVFAQRFDDSAVPVALGTQISVNTTTVNDQKEPAISMNASGEFVIVWQSKGQDNLNGKEVFTPSTLPPMAAPMEENFGLTLQHSAIP